MKTEKFYAGFWVRFFAALLDLAVLAPLFALLLYLFGVNDYEFLRVNQDFSSYTYMSASGSNRTVDYITYGLSIAYLTYFLCTKGQATIGKKIMGIYVGNPDGSRLSTLKSFVRALASILTAATLGLGFLMVIFTKEKIALHDLICRTRVFHGRKNGN